MQEAAPGMTTTNTTSESRRSPFGDALISRYEVLLFCAAAFLLAAAYPFKETVSPIPANIPVSSDTIDVVEQLKTELEAHNTTQVIDPENTTVLLEHSDLVDIPTGEPAS